MKILFLNKINNFKNINFLKLKMSCNCKYYCDCEFTQFMIKCKIDEEKKDEENEKLKDLQNQETIRLITQHLKN